MSADNKHILKRIRYSKDIKPKESQPKPEDISAIADKIAKKKIKKSKD